MLVNNNLTESNLDALRKSILTETSITGTTFGNFKYNCTVKATEEKILYRVKFEMIGEENQTLVVLSDKPASYILAMLVAPIAHPAQHKILRKRFPCEGKYVTQGFEDFKNHQSVAILTSLVSKQEVIEYDYLRGKIQNIYVEQHTGRNHIVSVVNELFHKLNCNLYLNNILTVINFILLVVVVWKQFLN